MKKVITLSAIVTLVLALNSTALAAFSWAPGWNDMGTVSGGSVSFQLRSSGALEYVQIDQGSIVWEGVFDNDGTDDDWADVFGDQGQYYFDGAIRNDWYDGSVPVLTAYDWNGSTGVADGTFEWLVNNYEGPDGNPGAVKNSHIRGLDSSFTYNETDGTFIADLASDGTWYWYTVGTLDSSMSGWSYGGLTMSGNFRLIGNFADDGGLPVLETATLQYELVPEPATLALLGLGGLLLRKRK